MESQSSNGSGRNRGVQCEMTVYSGPRSDSPLTRTKVRGKDIPIVHRVVRTFPEVEGKAKKVKEITVYVSKWSRCTPDSVLTCIDSDSTPSHMLLTKVCFSVHCVLIVQELTSYAFRYQGDNNLADDTEL